MAIVIISPHRPSVPLERPAVPSCYVCNATPAQVTLVFLANLGLWECIPCMYKEGSWPRPAPEIADSD